MYLMPHKSLTNRSSVGKFIMSLLILFFGAALHAVYGQCVKPCVVERPVKASDISTKTVRSVLGDLASKDGIPIGIESAVDSGWKAPEEFASTRVVGGTVRDVLNAVTSIMPLYTWREVDGVINVLPMSEREPLLSVQIAQFTANNQTRGEIVDAIFETQEVTAKLSELKLARDGTTPLPSGDVKIRKRYSFKLQNVEVRDILNYLLRETECRYWNMFRVRANRGLVAVIVW